MNEASTCSVIAVLPCIAVQLRVRLDQRPHSIQMPSPSLAVVYWELGKDRGKLLTGKELKEQPAYYPFLPSSSASRPNSLAKFCWTSVPFERTRATRWGAFASWGG